MIRRIKYHNRESWLRERRRGIGDRSDIGAILGLSRWRSPLDVYLDKIGEAEEQESSDAMYWGTVLEGIVADEYARRTGKKVRKINAILACEGEPWRRASVDRLVIGERKILECKTAGAHMGHEWGPDGSDEVPDVYRAQVAWYQHVLDHDDRRPGRPDRWAGLPHLSPAARPRAGATDSGLPLIIFGWSTSAKKSRLIRSAIAICLRCTQ